MNLSSLEKRIAMIENEQVVEFLIEHPSNNEIAGNIYYGKVTDVLPGMNAAFVDIGIWKNGYLHRDQTEKYYVEKAKNHESTPPPISSLVHQGEKILVQVMKESFGTKGPKLSGVIELHGINIVYLPFGHSINVSKKIEAEREKWRKLGKKWLENKEGIVFRTSCEGLDEEIVYQELCDLREQFKQIKQMQATAKVPVLLHDENTLLNRLIREIPLAEIDEIVVDDFDFFQTLKQYFEKFNIQPKMTHYTKKENIFSHYLLEQQLQTALQQTVSLSEGVSIIIEHTEAMTIIDVNTGKNIGRSNLKETVLKTNLLAAKEIVRQIRLRNIGGIIIIDFINMKDENDKRQVLQALQRAFLADRAKTTIYGFTKLGMVELSRKKVRPHLTMMLTNPCEACCGTGRVMSSEAISYKLERELLEYRFSDIEAIWIETSASVSTCLRGKNNEHLKWLEDTLKFQIYLTENEYLTTEYLIRHVGTREEVALRVLDAKSKNNR